jgi:hypothetical protein
MALRRQAQQAGGNGKPGREASHDERRHHTTRFNAMQDSHGPAAP